MAVGRGLKKVGIFSTTSGFPSFLGRLERGITVATAFSAADSRFLNMLPKATWAANKKHEELEAHFIKVGEVK